MMGLGMPEILVILVLVLILFGAGKLPKVMGDLGKGVNAFKEGLNSQDSGAGESTVAQKKSRKPVKVAARTKSAKPRA